LQPRGRAARRSSYSGGGARGGWFAAVSCRPGNRPYLAHIKKKNRELSMQLERKKEIE